MLDRAQKDTPRITRRAFVGLGGVAALSLFAGTRLAWGGVGSGVWGNAGGTAWPGSQFGCDGGWGYSSNGRVWLAVSCNAVVGRMTELFLEISVTSYYANGGVWSPTWFTDYADTHVDSFVRNGEGVWLSSTSGFYDTTYDSSTFHGPYATHVLRVKREPWDWWSWAGVRAWCDSPDSAYGINAVAEASQLIPHHVLVDDRSWQGRIVTLRPRAAQHLYADAMGGGTNNGTNVAGWETTHTTNQNWLVLTSAQGRTCFVPVHVGESARYLDVDGAVWDDGVNVHLWEGNGSPAQSYYLHNLGGGWHLIVAECSGCALDLSAGGQANGTNIVQFNCLDNWQNANQQWMLDEVEFCERQPGTMVVVGDARAGSVLAAPDAGPLCFPYNYPSTSGLRYRYAWYRGMSPGDRAELVQNAREDASYAVSSEDEGQYLTCVVTAYARYGDVKYKGEVELPSVLVEDAYVTVRYFVDGESDPCFEERVDRALPHAIPENAWSSAEKPGCAGVDGWYRDAAYTIAYAQGALLDAACDLYAYNRVVLAYAPTQRSFDGNERTLFLDETLTVPFSQEAAVPPQSEHRYGDRVELARGASAWFEDRGRTREMACSRGAYAHPDASGAPFRSARLTRNATVYLDWTLPLYDGIEVA